MTMKPCTTGSRRHVDQAASSPECRRFVALCLAAVFALVAVQVGALPSQAATRARQMREWHGYHADPSNNAAFTEPGRGPVSWRSPAVNDQILAVSVVGDQVFEIGGGHIHAVYALDRDNGQMLWARILDNLIMTQPVVAGGRIFVGTGNNYMREDPVLHWSTVYRGTESNSIYALDTQTGAVIWRLRLQGEAMPTPVYHDGMLYWVTGDRRFLAIDAVSGRIVWSLHLPSYMSMSSPVRDGNLLIFGGAHPYVEYAVDIAARRLAWEHPFATFESLSVTGAVDDCSAALYDHTVFCTATASTAALPAVGAPIRQFAWALDARNGHLLWQEDLGAGSLPNFFAAGVPLALNGVVYLESPGNRGLFALSTRTGQPLWHITLAAMSRSAPVLDGHALFVTSDMGMLFQLDARSGGLLHRMYIGGAFSNLGLVLASGTLFVPNAGAGLTDTIPERVLTAAPGLDVIPPYGPVVATQGGATCG